MQYTDYQQLPLILSVDDLADILGIGRNSSYALVRSGQIRVIKCGRMIRIPKDALLKYLGVKE